MRPADLADGLAPDLELDRRGERRARAAATASASAVVIAGSTDEDRRRTTPVSSERGGLDRLEQRRLVDPLALRPPGDDGVEPCSSRRAERGSSRAPSSSESAARAGAKVEDRRDVPLHDERDGQRGEAGRQRLAGGVEGGLGRGRRVEGEEPVGLTP